MKSNYYDILYDVLDAFEKNLRQTGRTTEIVRKARAGDIIVVHDVGMRDHIRDMVGPGSEITIKIVNPSDFDEVEFIAKHGRVHFDNAFVFLYYHAALYRAAKLLNIKQEEFLF